MTKRERIYHWRKSKIGVMTTKMRRQVLESFIDIGMAGSWVGLNENGEVEARILSAGECLDLLNKQSKGEPIPPEYTITN